MYVEETTLLYVDTYVLRAGSTTNHLVCTNCRSIIDCWAGSSLVPFFLFGVVASYLDGIVLCILLIDSNNLCHLFFGSVIPLAVPLRYMFWLEMHCIVCLV